jgi:excisionase family DNA binding protein
MTTKIRNSAESPTLTVPEACSFLGVSRRTLERLAAKHKVKPVRVSPGRVVYLKAHLELYLKSRLGA